MIRLRLFTPIVLLGALGCAETSLAPIDAAVPVPLAHVGAPASSCTLAPLPADAHVIACFNTTLQPGVWHGWVLEIATAQPPGTDGNFSRTRLNHQYLLASPQGYTQWGPSDPIAPPLLFQNTYAFQAEFNGTVWWDVVRLHAAANGTPQTVPVVVYWLDATGAGGVLSTAVNSLLTAGVINRGQANALTRKIDQALDLFANGKTADAILVLQGFVQQVNDLTYIDGVLSPAEAQQLVSWAQYMITSLASQCTNCNSGTFAGLWSGTYDFGPMSAVLQQSGSAVFGEITDAASCVWDVSGTASGNDLNLPTWTLRIAAAPICVGATVTLIGTLDASGNSIAGTGTTALAGSGPIPWTFSWVRN